MHAVSKLLLPLSAVAAVQGAAMPEAAKAQGGCTSFTIINTRGTGEPQGESAGFKTMNSLIQVKLPGGKIYNTVYAADWSQNSGPGTKDIIDKIASTLHDNPDECFILEGYSQGAAATVNALPQISGAGFDAVKGVFLIGDPYHKSGLECNVDNKGGETTKNVNGLSAATSEGIPENWISKTLDVCIFADGVCDTTHGVGINLEHLQYPLDKNTQQLGTTFVIKQLTS